MFTFVKDLNNLLTNGQYNLYERNLCKAIDREQVQPVFLTHDNKQHDHHLNNDSNYMVVVEVIDDIDQDLMP